MLNSYNIESLFSSSQDNPFARFNTIDQQPFHNSNQNQENPPLLSTSNFPTFIDEHQFPPSQIFMSSMQATIQGDDQKEATKRTSPAPPMSRRNTSGRKSTHSKICTAQGVRGRRMRLSLPIARKFFHLQDLLGFDKASKTIEWLLSNSQEAIKELQRKIHSQEAIIDPKLMHDHFEAKSSAKDVEENRNNERITKSRNSFYNNCSHAKECRERARARARERTREKMMMKMKGIKQMSPSLSNEGRDLKKQCLGTFFPFEDLAGVSHEKGYYDSTGFTMLQNLDDMRLVTNNNPVSNCCLPTRKFPFLLQ